MQRYHLDFILTAYSTSADEIKNSLTEFGEGLEVIDCQDSTTLAKNFKIKINAEGPTVIFDICAQFGRIKSVKIDENGIS
jgi:dihydroxyacetone kinase-like predicted kinase